MSNDNDREILSGVLRSQLWQWCSDPNQIQFGNSPDVLACYELARDTGELRSENGEKYVVIRRFQNKPRYRIWQIDAKPETLLRAARRLAAESYRPVAIHNLDGPDWLELQELHPAGVLQVSDEVIVSTSQVVAHPDHFFSRSQLSALRRDQREISHYVGFSADRSEFVAQGAQVVDAWKAKNAGKHFRLSITRDYRALEHPWGYKFLGIRAGAPVCLQIFFEVPGQPEMVIQAVEKSLNYRDQPGGRPGTSDANFYLGCERLLAEGKFWMNTGTFDGGNKGLGERKKKLADHVIQSAVFTTRFIHRKDAV